MEGLALESFNVIGRTAMFLGTAIDTALEGTANMVSNVSKRADHIAQRVARSAQPLPPPPPQEIFSAPVTLHPTP